MSDITAVKQGELEVMYKASLYLREKLLKNDRNGPLVKLLTREIDIFSDELARRRPDTKTQVAKQVSGPVNLPTTPRPVSASNGNYDGKTTMLPKKSASSPTGKLNESKSVPAQKPATPIQRPTITQPQSQQQPVRGLLSKVTQTQPVVSQSKLADSKHKNVTSTSPKTNLSASSKVSARDTSTETVVASDK